MNTLPIIQLTDVQPDSYFCFSEPLDLSLLPGENWIIYGSNGSGKTALANTLRSSYRLKQGKIDYHFNNPNSNSAYNNISYVAFTDRYGAQQSSMPYQMRWNRGAIDLTLEPMLGDYLPQIKKLPHSFVSSLFSDDWIRQMEHMPLLSLSSGEFRRFQLLLMLSKMPRVLIIDNPYIGLDMEGRKIVENMLDAAIKTSGITIIVVLSRMPESVGGFTHVINVSGGKVTKKSANEFLCRNTEENTAHVPSRLRKPLPVDPQAVVEAKDITIQYGDRVILNHFNLRVNEGESWAVNGPNGSGKSTLLSLICADNPQAYACNISLFGRRRGSGESIWEIKRHIGFVSPEMFSSINHKLTAREIVAGGMFDTHGFYKHIGDEQLAQAEKWIAAFEIRHLADRPFVSLSFGEQRMVLLCRAFVKEPSLLLLDEPFHGLDEQNRHKALKIITEYTGDPTHTLIMVSHYSEDFPATIDHTLTLSRNK